MNRVGRGGRRRSPRVRIRLEGSLVGRVPRPVTLLDLSLTGCLLQCDTLLDHGAILDLRLSLDPDPFLGKVRVVDSYLDGGPGPQGAPRYLAGLEFLGLGVREETLLRRFLARESRGRDNATGR